MSRMTFDRLQKEHGEWADRNFPGSTDNEAFHGIVEEAGELSTALLALDAAHAENEWTKVEASIREVSDAIGDTTIFLADYARRRGLVITEILAGSFGYNDGDDGGLTLCRLQEKASMGADDSDPAFSLWGAIGKLAHARLKSRQGIRAATAEHLANERDAVGEIAIWLSLLCSREGLCYERIVTDTWAVVKCRDWLANPETGRALPAPQDVTVPAEPDVYPAAYPARSTMPYEV